MKNCAFIIVLTLSFPARSFAQASDATANNRFLVQNFLQHKEDVAAMSKMLVVANVEASDIVEAKFNSRQPSRLYLVLKSGNRCGLFATSRDTGVVSNSWKTIGSIICYNRSGLVLSQKFSNFELEKMNGLIDISLLNLTVGE